MKVVINKCFGGYSLSKEAYKYLGLSWGGYGYKFQDDRTNPKLVEVVEKLGEKANGQFADLKVVEIPNNINWFISDYDGIEKIEEEHKIWK